MCSLLTYLRLSLSLQKWMDKVNMDIPTSSIPGQMTVSGIGTWLCPPSEIIWETVLQWLEKRTFLHWVTEKTGSLHRHSVTKRKSLPELHQSPGHPSWETDSLSLVDAIKYLNSAIHKAVLRSHQWARKYPFFVKLVWSGFLSHITKKHYREAAAALSREGRKLSAGAGRGYHGRDHHHWSSEVQVAGSAVQADEAEERAEHL